MVMKKILLTTFAAFLQAALFLPLSAQNSDRMQKNLEALFVDAVQYYEDENYKDAKARLSVIVEAEPSNDAAYYYSGLCDFYLGNVKDAEAELREAVRLDPKNYWYRDRLAVFYSMTGQEELTTGI